VEVREGVEERMRECEGKWRKRVVDRGSEVEEKSYR